MRLFPCCLTSFSSNIFTDISYSFSFVWLRFLEGADIRCKVTKKLFIMRLQMNFIFFIFICFDRNPFWSIDIYFMRKSKWKFNFSWSFHIKFISNSDHFKSFCITFWNTNCHILEHSTSQSPKCFLLFIFRIKNRDYKSISFLCDHHTFKNIKWKYSFWSCKFHFWWRKSYRNSCWDFYGLFSDSRHNR